MTASASTFPPLRSFGRIKARPLKPRQAWAIETLAPAAAAPAAGPLDGGWREAAAGFGLEIGFGAGEHFAAQAQARPDWAFLGIEPFINGAAQALLALDAVQAIPRARAHIGDVRDLLPRVPTAAVDCVWILFPDPWPKARHWKRRLIQPEFVAELARVLKPRGELRFATDWKHYAAWSLERFLAEPRLEWLAERAADWRAPWPGHVTTRYEAKALGDTPPIFLRFKRCDGA